MIDSNVILFSSEPSAFAIDTDSTATLISSPCEDSTYILYALFTNSVQSYVLPLLFAAVMASAVIGFVPFFNSTLLISIPLTFTSKYLVVMCFL